MGKGLTHKIDDMKAMQMQPATNDDQTERTNHAYKSCMRAWTDML